MGGKPAWRHDKDFDGIYFLRKFKKNIGILKVLIINVLQSSTEKYI